MQFYKAELEDYRFLTRNALCLFLTAKFLTKWSLAVIWKKIFNRNIIASEEILQKLIICGIFCKNN